MSGIHKSLTIVLVVLVLYALCNVEGRYLPTRADNTRYEHMKEVLRALLDLNEQEGHGGRQNYPFDDVLRAKRSTDNHAHPAQTVDA